MFRTLIKAVSGVFPVAALALTGIISPTGTMAGDARPETLSFIYIDSADNAAMASDGVEIAGYSVFDISALPQADQARTLVTGEMLKGRAVSILGRRDESGVVPRGRSGQFVVATRIALNSVAGDTPGFSVVLGDESMSPENFAKRLSAMVDAFAHGQRAVGYIDIADSEGLFPQFLNRIEDMFSATGMPLWVLAVQDGSGQCGVSAIGTLPLALTSGVADRVPLGNEDQITTVAEAEAYIEQSVSRKIRRSEACRDSYVALLSTEDALAPVAYHVLPLYFDVLEAGILLETCDAELLSESEQAEPVRAYLDSCTYCPKSKALEAHLAGIERTALQASVEDKIWARLQEAPDKRRIGVYLERCTLCKHRDAAEDLLGQIDETARLTAEERKEFAALKGSDDLAGLRGYVDGCTVCSWRDAALEEISAIEAQAAYRREATSRDVALKARDRVALTGWLDSCEICEGRSGVEAEMTRLTKLEELLVPCRTAAGLPQQGGPRLLRDIDVDTAEKACTVAAEAFPGSPEIAVLKGRIDQAKGDFRAAASAYDTGMAADVPVAFGLAGYLRYEPPAGATWQQDFAAAEALAQTGAEQGDWLSRQLLSVLYSQSLIDGRTPADAVAAAKVAAEEGDPVSQFFMGYFNLTGTGIDTGSDTVEAERWLGRAVEAGYLPAYAFMAELLEEKANPQASEKAAELLVAAVRGGDSTALLNLTSNLSQRQRATVRAVQTRLAQLDVYNGDIDGLPGPGTLAAVQRLAQGTRRVE